MSRSSPNKYALRHTSQGQLAKNVPPVMTRQRIRAALREQCFREISGQYGLEPRRARRRMALRLARRRYKAQTTGLLVGKAGSAA